MNDWSKKFLATVLAMVLVAVSSVALLRVFDLMTEPNLMTLAWLYSVLCLCVFIRMTGD